MSTEQLAQALRDIAEHRMSMCGADDFHHLKKIARTALAVHELEKAAQSAVPGWCPGCTPDNCQGCGVVGGQDLSRKTAPAAPASASEAPVAAPLTDELVGKLLRTQSALGKMGKKYGEIGSRDVDVARWNADLYEAIAAVGDVLADQPLEQLARVKLEGGQE